jgi:NAD(P)-dependent dehydrogenase (short-subunit alcohol dehydrogenase family)
VHDLTGRVVLVTGASKGIGQAMARALGAAGANVIAHFGSDYLGALDAVSELPAERRLVVQADLGVRGAAKHLWADAVAWQGRIDVVVNNAAILLESPLDATDPEWDEAWDRTLAVNLRSLADLTREAVRHFLERGGGVLISFSSWVAQQGSSSPDLLAYSASKGAIEALTHTVARTRAADGVLAYLIAPGLVRTQMSIDAAAGADQAAITALLAMREWVPPAEIGELVVFLATGRQRHLTGATFDVNGASYIR